MKRFHSGFFFFDFWATGFFVGPAVFVFDGFDNSVDASLVTDFFFFRGCFVKDAFALLVDLDADDGVFKFCLALKLGTFRCSAA